MNKIDKVEAILYKANQSVVFDAPPHRPIGEVATEINKLYEPQPDQSSRLLNEATVMLKSETGHPYLADISYFLGLQDTKTASIKDAERKDKNSVDVAEAYFRGRADGVTIGEFDSQARIEALIEWVDERLGSCTSEGYMLFHCAEIEWTELKANPCKANPTSEVEG